MPQYELPSGERESLKTSFPVAFELLEDRDAFGNWTVMAKEPGRWVMRSRDLVYMMVKIEGSKATSYELIEGEAAKKINLDYAFRFSDAEKASWKAKLPKGAPALDTIIKAFGSNAREAPLMAQVAQPGGAVKRYHRALDRGLIIVVVEPGDKLGEVQFVTGPEAFQQIQASVAAAKR